MCNACGRPQEFCKCNQQGPGERITLLETQVAELREALQQCRILLDGVGHNDKHDARLANQIGGVIQAALASPAANCVPHKDENKAGAA